MENVVETYMQCGDFHTAVKRSGLPIKVAYLELMKSGCMKIQDKIKFGSKGARLGGQAEELFQKLVPEAIDANRYFKKNNPVYDFILQDLTIDVKYSSLRKDPRSTTGRGYWGIRATGNQDFIVAFLERNEGTQLEDPYILCLPMAFVSVKSTLNVTFSSPFFKEFMLEPEELSPYLKEFAELKAFGG